MPTKIIRQPEHLDALKTILGNYKLPLTVSWSQGASRSQAQNRLYFKWYSEIAQQMGDRDAGDVRAYCKIVHGVPILSAENDGFRESWAATFGALPFEMRVEYVKRLEQPVTSLMNMKQASEYMSAVQREFLGLGLWLTDPLAAKYQDEFQ